MFNPIAFTRCFLDCWDLRFTVFRLWNVCLVVKSSLEYRTVIDFSRIFKVLSFCKFSSNQPWRGLRRRSSNGLPKMRLKFKIKNITESVRADFVSVENLQH
jgi:hypothetical protein